MKKHAENVTRINQTFWNLKEIWPATSRGNRMHDKFILQVRRTSLFDDMIAKLSLHDIDGGSYWGDAFKINLEIAFTGEDGLDYGGVRKEFFALLF